MTKRKTRPTMNDLTIRDLVDIAHREGYRLNVKFGSPIVPFGARGELEPGQPGALAWGFPDRCLPRHRGPKLAPWKGLNGGESALLPDLAMPWRDR